MTPIQLHILDLVERASKTFIQAFMPAWALTNYSLSKVAIFSSICAALSVGMNVTTKIQNYLNTPAPSQLVAQPIVVTPHELNQTLAAQTK